jgi:immune inhibitor A
MPRARAAYANNEVGLGLGGGGVGQAPNLQMLAADAYAAVEPFLGDTVQYDCDSNGYIDAFMVVHAGSGAQQTLDPTDLWSAKWVMPEAIGSGKSKLYAFLTLPEDSKLGMACHELGHLVFGWPDLHVPIVDSEPGLTNQNAGLGDWCLMASGGWIGSGDTPSHPSAWCKKQQGWVEVVNETFDRSVAITDVKVDGKVHRLWKNGNLASSEYFLVENRANMGYDAALPGHGLLSKFLPLFKMLMRLKFGLQYTT